MNRCLWFVCSKLEYGQVRCSIVSSIKFQGHMGHSIDKWLTLDVLVVTECSLTLDVLAVTECTLTLDVLAVTECTHATARNNCHREGKTTRSEWHFGGKLNAKYHHIVLQPESPSKLSDMHLSDNVFHITPLPYMGMHNNWLWRHNGWRRQVEQQSWQQVLVIVALRTVNINLCLHFVVKIDKMDYITI